MAPAGLLGGSVGVRFGSIATEIGFPRHVRFPSDSDRRADMARRPKSANTDRDPPSDRNLAERQVIDSIADVATTFAQQGVTLTCRCSFVQTKIRELAEGGRP